MRIQQLAKKLNLTTTVIEEVLVEKCNWEKGGNANKKLDEEQIDLILKALKKSRKDLEAPSAEKNEVVAAEKNDAENPSIGSDDQHVAQSIAEEKDVVVEEASSETTEENLNVEDKAPSEDATTNELEQEKTAIQKESSSEREIIDTGETTLHMEDGVIKAPKVELRGPVVKGKIDLPEKAKKAEKEEANESSSEEETEPKQEEKIIPTFEKKQRPKKKSNTKKKNKSKAETLAEKKAKEDKIRAEREAKRKKIIEEKRKEHYFKHVQPKVAKKASTKAPKKVKPVEPAVSAKKSAAEKPAPKSLWGKFIAWLNGA